MINPAIVDGQVAGRVVQGIGSVLWERIVYDESGQPVTTTLLDYLLPTAGEVPEIEIVHLESPPQGPIDFRGVGENGAVGALAAVANAVEDALRPFGVRGHGAAPLAEPYPRPHRGRVRGSSVILTHDFDDHIEEAKAVNAMIADVSPPLRLATRDDIRQVREMEADPDSPFVAFAAQTELPVEERTVPGPAGDIPVRISVPDTVEAVYVDIHGGAWIIGSAQMMDAENTRLAAACNVATVSIEYRLAPENPWPAGADDCEAVVAWLLEHAGDEFGVDRLLIGGGSAGATLSAITMLRVRDRLDAIERIVGANLVYGCYDLSRTPSQRRRDDTLIIDAEAIGLVLPWVFPGVDAEGLRDPRSPRSTRTCAGCHPRSSPSAPTTRSSTTRCSSATRWRPPATRPSWPCIRRRPTGSTCSRRRWPASRPGASTTSSAAASRTPDAPSATVGFLPAIAQALASAGDAHHRAADGVAGRHLGEDGGDVAEVDGLGRCRAEGAHVHHGEQVALGVDEHLAHDLGA